MSPTDALLDAAWEIWMRAVRESGWGPVVIMLGCTVAAVFCLSAARTLPGNDAGRSGWTLAGAALAALGVCALLRLDLLAALTMRGLVQAQGWYGARRPIQFGLLLGCVAAALALAGRARARLGGDPATLAVALAGTAAIGSVTLLRAVSFHGTDAVLEARLAGLTLGRLAELAGLALVFGAAVRRLRGA